MNTFKHGTFCWNELMTSQPQAAAKFYKALFGWELIRDDSAGMDYILIRQYDNEVGGIMKSPEELPVNQPPSWGTYVAVDDVDETVELAKTLGATILKEPVNIPGAGRFCVVQDPQGAVFLPITLTS